MAHMALHTWHAYRYGSSLRLLALGSAATLTARAVRARAIAATLAGGTSLASYGTYQRRYSIVVV